MSGFANQIIGGLSKLIRPAIQSPNYAPGSAGWTINQDGSAEFNDATFRGTVVISSGGTALLVYSGVPAAGNMILAISAQGGTDNFGNHYNAGITISADTVNPALSWLDNAGTWGSDFPFMRASLANGLIIQGPSNPGGPAATLSMDANTTTELLMYDNGVNVQSIESHQDALSIHAGGYTNFYAKDDGSGFCFGTDNANNGRVGKYYFEQVETGNGQSIPANTSTIINIQSITYLFSDYGSKFSAVTDEWACPVSGLYLIGAFVEYSTVPSGITRNGIYIQQSDNNGATWRNIDYNETAANVSSCNTPPIYIPQGSLIRFEAWHNGTTAGTLDANCFACARRFL